jgi:hypothetical protein
MPMGTQTNPVIVERSRGVAVIANAWGLNSSNVSFELLEPPTPYPGFVAITGRHTAHYYPSSAVATVRLRVTADAMSSVSSIVYLQTTGSRSLDVLPSIESTSAITLGSAQTFALVDNYRSTQLARGVANTEWFLWANDTRENNPPVNGTFVASMTGPHRIYARDPQSNQWASVDFKVATAVTQPSIEIRPSVATVAPGGVVQLTALVSSGGQVTWAMLGNSGDVSANGTVTAPTTPGVYVVQATPVGGTGMHYGLATIIVQ